MPTHAAHGYADMGVRPDWGSRFQPPYAKEEEATMEAASASRRTSSTS